MTSSHHAPYDLGYTRATMDGTTRSEPAKASGIPSVAVKCVDIRRNTSGEGGLLDSN